MTYETLVATFQSLSGRYDLDTETILLYLNEGQRFLDDSTDFAQQPAHYIYSPIVGQSFLSLVAQAKSISKLSLVLGNERHYLTRLSVNELQALEVTLPSYKDQALPEYFALANLRNVGGTIPVGDTGKLALVEIGTVSDKLGILFNCPLDKAYTIDVAGKFYSPAIEEDVDPDTFWAIQYPLTLVHSALYKLEVGYRNSEGMKDWLNAIGTILKSIDENVAEQDSEGVNQMRG